MFWYPGPDAEPPFLVLAAPSTPRVLVESLGAGESGLPSMSRADVIKAFPACHTAYGTC